MDFTTIVVALIGAVPVSLAAWWSYKAATRVKTKNGSTAGELTDFIAEEIAWLRISFVEHARDQEIHRTQAHAHDEVPVQEDD